MDQSVHALDLEAYFRRIDYAGPREATRETLAALHLNHPLAIAFENLDPLLKRPVKLDLASLQQKLVHDGRGGYCFEQNLFFMAVLRALGFTVSGLGARVLWNQREGAVTPRTHMLLRVELPDGTYLADVGFGALTLTAPLLLKSGEQETPHELFRLDRDGKDWRMSAQLGEEWRTLYRFGMEEHFQVDYEISNYFISTNPASHFIHSLIAARPTHSGRHTLSNTRLSTYRGNERQDQRELQSPQEVESVLRDIFGIAVPGGEDLAHALRRESVI